MLLDGRRAILKVVISVLLCKSLAGQTGTSPRSSISSTRKPTANNYKKTTSNVTSQQSSNSTLSTTPTKEENQEYFFSATDRKNIIIVTMTVATTGALFNAAVILAIIVDPLKILRKGSWITIFNLAIADLLSCISCVFLWGEIFIKPINDKELYWAICDFGWAFGVSASFIFLTFLTVQIYIITKFPLKSRFMFTTTKIVLCTIAIWLFASLLGLSDLAYLHFRLDDTYKIYMTRIGLLEIALFIQVLLNLQVSALIMKSGRSSVGRRSHQINRHRNIAKTVIILTLILFFTAFPYFVMKQIEYGARLGYFGESKTANLLAYLSYCYAPIAILNFTANPILYSLRQPDYRQTLLIFVGKARGKNVTPRETTSHISSTKQTNTFHLHSQNEKKEHCGQGH